MKNQLLRAAREQGLSIFVGHPCIVCNLRVRYVSSGSCKACTLNRVAKKSATGFFKEYYKKNREMILERGKNYRKDQRKKGLTVNALKRKVKELEDKLAQIKSCYVECVISQTEVT
jgi:hypothetical protein